MTRGKFVTDDRSAISLHLRDESSAISDHLHSHVHLTNCIHLKNHMHRHSPFPGERSLMRDLITLQRSRSLRDPSTSPPFWISPSIVSACRLAKDSAIHSGRRSTGVDRRREIGRLSTSSPQAPCVATSKVAAAEESSDDNIADKAKDVRSKTDEPIGREDPPESLVQEKMEARGKKIACRGNRGQSVHLKTLSEQLEEAPSHTNNQKCESSHVCRHRRQSIVERICEEPEASSHSHRNGAKRMKKQRLRSVRAARGPMNLRGHGIHKDMAIFSNSLAKASTNRERYLDNGQEEDTELEVSWGPRNGCGIPWNWSRIHHRGKTFLDMAGRSFSCGLSDSKLKKAEGKGPVPQSQEDASNKPVPLDPLSSSPNSESEALPLLLEASGSQESTGNPFLVQDYSGELGIFANHNLRHERDSDLESEARSGHHRRSQGRHYRRHISLTQKYMPRTFKDLVGQNLVVQALSNAVLRRKIGFVYVFYGPHGTGKTSCAHLFAKALNCQSMEHPKPCDICTCCISHNLGKSRNLVEIGPVGNLDFESIMDVLDNVVSSPISSQYRVFVVDDCDTLSSDAWSIISKVIDQAPRHVVFILISSNLDHLPHTIMSRCQKFFFPKLKDSDIVCTLQWIATSEGLEIDKNALKLIASRSDGSLRDAEMTLDQLSLLGQRISLPVVQELVGLVSDEKLVDLLDLALSADTVNTVKNLREIMETGVDPLALMSQLATIITDILAGSYVFTPARVRRKFFRRLALSKKDMEKLRQALKTLSEAEKQLRASNDKLTWLTAALLQLAPDQQYMLSSSSKETSNNESPVVLNNICDVPSSHRGLLRRIGQENLDGRGANDVMQDDSYMTNYYSGGKGHVGHSMQALTLSAEAPKANNGGNERIWQAVLESLQSDALRQFLFQEAKLISVRLGAAPTVQLMFSSHAKKSKAEKFREHILKAFEYVLRSSVILEIRCASKEDLRVDDQVPFSFHASSHDPSQMITKQEFDTNERSLCSMSEDCAHTLLKENVVKGVGSSQYRQLFYDPFKMAKNEITEVGTSLQEHDHIESRDNAAELSRNGQGSAWVEEASSSQHLRKENGEPPRRQSLVKGKVSLAHVIQRAEGCTQRSGWSKRKAISIAEKLEQENLRLEPRSRSLLCWRSSRVTRGKSPHLRIRTRRSRSLLKIMTCGRCLRARSPT